MKMTFDVVGTGNHFTLALLEFESSSPALIEALKTNIGESRTFAQTTEFYIEKLPISGITQVTVEAAVPFQTILESVLEAKKHVGEGYNMTLEVETANRLGGYVNFPMVTADEMAEHILGREMLPVEAAILNEGSKVAQEAGEEGAKALMKSLSSALSNGSRV